MITVGPRLCLVIPTMGERLDWLRMCIESICSQGDVPEVLVRIVTPDAQLRNRLGALPDHLEFVVRPAAGLANAISAGWHDLPESIEFVGWLGDDDLLAPRSLATTTAALQSHPSASCVFGRVRYIDSNGGVMWLQRSFRAAPWYAMYGKNFVPQQGSLFRWSHVQAVGGIDETLRTAMDQDLFCKLQSQGPGIYVHAELAAYRWHATNLTVLKGQRGDDEGELVRQRYRSKRLNYLIRPLRKMERPLYKAMRLMPAPPVPCINGKTYVSP